MNVYLFPQRNREERRVRGTVLLSTLQWVGTYYGDEAERQLRKRLVPDIQDGISRISRTGWYPYWWMNDLIRAMGAAFGRRRNGLVHELGRHSAHLDVAALYRGGSMRSVDEYLLMTTLLHRQRYDFGRVAFAQEGTHIATMLHQFDAECEPISCEFFRGFYEQVLIEHGVKDGAVGHFCEPGPEPSCRFTLSWKEAQCSEDYAVEAIAT